MNEERLLKVLKSPHISEKTTMVGDQGNQYVFQVAVDANKPEIKAAVEKLFDVKVENVNVTRVKGKNTGFRGRAGKRAGWKKAYVRIAEGQSIEIGVGAE